MKKISKRSICILATLMAFAVMMIAANVSAFAEDGNDFVGRVLYEGHVESFDSLSDLVKYVEDDCEGKTITIYMFKDWGNARLVIPKGTTATLEMDSHMFNRGLASKEEGWESDGECIYINNNASLTINGNDGIEQLISHSVPVFTSRYAGDKTDGTQTIEGGVIAGGASTNGGGGIHIETNGKLTLNYVTIAGCRAEYSGWYSTTSTGYGGGINANENGITINMNNSTITGCYASEGGGGIYVDDVEPFALNMTKSFIEKNYYE